MANEINYQHDQTGATIYAIVQNAAGQVWSVSGSAFVTMAVADWDLYDIALTETPASSCRYLGTFPAGIVAAGVYSVSVYQKGGATVVPADEMVGSDVLRWSGAAEVQIAVPGDAMVLSATGLDAIPTTAPAGVAADFREMIVQLWRRFFKKATQTATQIKTFADNGADVLTTQAIFDNGVTKTQGPAT